MSDINLFLFIFNIAITVFVGFFLLILPQMTRKSYLFGVKIPLDKHNSPEAAALKRRYTRICLTLIPLLLLLEAAQYLLFPGKTLLSAMYFPLLLVPVQMLAFVPNWREALRLKRELGWDAPDAVYAETASSVTRGNLSELPKGWYAASLLIALLSLVITLQRYPLLPDPFPTHMGFNMVPDAWAEKTVLNVLTMPLINAATVALMLLVGISLVKARLQIDPEHPALSFAQHRAYRRMMGHASGFMTLCLALFMAVLHMAFVFPAWQHSSLPGLSFVLVGLPVVILVAVVIRAGQGGCRLKPSVVIGEEASVSGSAPKPSAASDDRHWKLGMFYYNPEDPANIVGDRFGSNIGFNYARKPVQIITALGLLALIAVYVWMTVFMWNVL